MLAVILVVTGVLMLAGVYLILTAPGVPKRLVRPMRCDAVSPDGAYQCVLDLAHNGWCADGDVEWRYETWAIGAEDSTRHAPLPGSTLAVEKTALRRRRIPAPLLVAGAAVILWTLVQVTDDTPPPAPTATCDWNAVRCDWK